MQLPMPAGWADRNVDNVIDYLLTMFSSQRFMEEDASAREITLSEQLLFQVVERTEDQEMIQLISKKNKETKQQQHYSLLWSHDRPSKGKLEATMLMSPIELTAEAGHKRAAQSIRDTAVLSLHVEQTLRAQGPTTLSALYSAHYELLTPDRGELIQSSNGLSDLKKMQSAAVNHLQLGLQRVCDNRERKFKRFAQRINAKAMAPQPRSTPGPPVVTGVVVGEDVHVQTGAWTVPTSYGRFTTEFYA